MKKIHLLIIFTSISFASCVVDPVDYIPSYSHVTFLKNTLDYPILVQCYFRPFNYNPFWCENELIPYSDTVEFQPNESKVVMDYMIPIGIKIFKSSDNTLLFEDLDGLQDLGDILEYSSEEAKNIGLFETEQIVNSPGVSSGYWIQDDRYLYENVPWDLYPIYFDYYSCYDLLITDMDKLRKKKCIENANGYAFVHCITLNPDADCFR
ncbi:MAG: hypothetical protein LBT04_06870 [Prevotellaceae bacterium]|nr:hypothetical protein [Prevotellaceae bacterium]